MGHLREVFDIDHEIAMNDLQQTFQEYDVHLCNNVRRAITLR